MRRLEKLKQTSSFCVENSELLKKSKVTKAK